MNWTTVGALLVAALYITVAAMVLVHPLPDKPYANDLPPARPGTDDQWSAFRDTVPNIRRAALTEHDVELAFHPASRDADVPFRFRWFGHHLLDTAATEQIPPVLAGPYQGRHRA